jgi:hypothetical protein
MNDIHAVIEAFADGEPVEPARLTHALSEPAGREHLIDLLALRGLVGGHETENRHRESVFPARAENRLPVSVFSRRGRSRLRAVLATAALVAVGALGGFVAGHRLAGTGASGPAVTAVNTPPRVVPVSAPPPTRVIHLENGVDWNERGGGD